MFKSRSKNIRRKVETVDDDPMEEESPEIIKKPTRPKNIRRKIEVSAEEPNDEAEVTITKRISTLEKKKKAAAKKSVNALSFDDEEQGGEEFQVKKTKSRIQLNVINDDLEERSNYNADYLKELRDNTPNLPDSVRLSLHKNDNDTLLHEKFPSMNNSASGSAIPDSSAILAAKKKREQMRKGFNITDNDDGFISLNDMDEEDDKAGSRLIREEDDLNDDGEAEFDQYVGDKITLNQTAAKKLEKERREGVREMIQEAEDDDDRSEDMDRWEEDMMKYGGVRSKKGEYDPYTPPADYKQAQVPESSVLPSLTDVLQTLNITTQDVTESMQQSESALQEASKTIENSTTTDSDLTNEIERGSKRYTYFQELAQYTDDLGEFLDAKFPELEKLETQVHDIISSKTEIVISRRYKDNLDDLCIFTDLVATTIDEEMVDEPEVDEFGRVRELRNSEASRKRRRQERKERIQRNVDLAELEGEYAIKEQSLWTDDEMNDEYYDQKDLKLEQAQTEGVDDLMHDVGSEYKTLSSVIEHFEPWKLDYYDDYEKAYGSLSLPGAFEFYIRSELVSWDPFNTPIDFDSMGWHSTLSQFGVTPEHEDPDIEMINKAVEKSILKRLKSLLDTLDVASLKQMRYAAQAVEQISYYVDTQEKAYQDLAADIIDTIEKQIAQFIDLVATAIPKSNLDQESIEAKERFFWSQCKYLKTLAVWRRQLPKEHLVRLGNIIYEKILLPILKLETYPNDAQLAKEASDLLAQLQK